MLGSGFVAAPCVEYLVRKPENKVTIGKVSLCRAPLPKRRVFIHPTVSKIASRRLENAQALSQQFPGTTAVSCDITNEEAIEKLVAEHDVAIRYAVFDFIKKERENRDGKGSFCTDTRLEQFDSLYLPRFGYQGCCQAQETCCHHFLCLSCHDGI